MKRICLLFTLLLIAGTLSARSADSTQKSHYEGSVSLTYTYLINLGIETIHGVRMCDEHLFLGGMAGGGLGLGLGAFAYAGFLPRYISTGKNVDLFVGLGINFIHYTPYRGSATPPSLRPKQDYAGGICFMPEVGIGIKLPNKDYIDVVLRCMVRKDLYDTYGVDKYSYRYPYPQLAIGYRF